MSKRENDHFLFTINCYNKSGLRRTSKWYSKFISLYILLPLLLILYAMIIYNFRFKKNNIFEIAEVFESVSTFGQLVARKLIIIIHGPIFEEVIQNRSRFWSYDLFGKETGKKFRNQMALCVNLIKCLWFGSVFSVVFHFCTPFFVENAVLPDACWVPENNEYVIFVLFALEILFYVEVIFLLGVFDAFFLCMCTDLKIQFNLLIRTLRSINTEMISGTMDEVACFRKLKESSEHHNFLLRVHKNVNDIYSEYFVCQYLINVGGVCIQFFIIDSQFSNITQILRSVVYIFIATLLAALIFLPSSTVEEEAEKFAIEIYNIKWQNIESLNIRKFLLLWLLKAQKPICMSGAGLFEVNRNVMIQVPRLAFSIATILSRT